jgi:serine/threonine-protein kinase
VVAYECLAGHVPFMASEPLAIAFAHKHAPVPPLPPDVPPPVADLVYDMLAKTPAGRPASARAVADRADVLREALFLGDTAMGNVARAGGVAGVTRADLPAARTGRLLGDDHDPARPGSRPVSNRRRWTTAGLTAALCALAAATGLYLSGHIHGQTGGDVGNTVHHLSSSAVTPSQSTSRLVTISPTPSTVEQPSTVPGTTVSPKPTKTSKPTSSPKTSPSSTSPSSSASSSTSASASSSASASASATASSSPTTTAP